MAKDLDSVCKQLQIVAGALSAVEKASEYARETETVKVFAVSYPFEGNMEMITVGDYKGLHTIITEIHFTTQVLESVLPNSIPIIEEFLEAAMADPTLSGTCDTIVGAIQYRFGFLSWGGQRENHVGPRFWTTVKIRS